MLERLWRTPMQAAESDRPFDAFDAPDSIFCTYCKRTVAEPCSMYGERTIPCDGEPYAA